MNEREYDRINNEGGEGYNPYRAERERKEFEEAREYSRKRAATPEGKIEALSRRIERECGSVAREWGDDNGKIDALQQDLYQQIQTIQKEIDDAFLAAWPLELTIERRASWNARAKAGEFNRGKGVDSVKLYKAEQAQGWTINQLKKAVEIYKLRGEIT